MTTKIVSLFAILALVVTTHTPALAGGEEDPELDALFANDPQACMDQYSALWAKAAALQEELTRCEGKNTQLTNDFLDLAEKVRTGDCAEELLPYFPEDVRDTIARQPAPKPQPKPRPKPTPKPKPAPKPTMTAEKCSSQGHTWAHGHCHPILDEEACKAKTGTIWFAELCHPERLSDEKVMEIVAEAIKETVMGRIEALELRMTTAEGRLDNHDTEISKLWDAVTSGDADSADGEVAEANQELDDVYKRLDELEKRQSELAKAKGYDDSDIRADIEKLRQELETRTGELSDDLDDLKARLQRVEDRLADLERMRRDPNASNEDVVEALREIAKAIREIKLEATVITGAASRIDDKLRDILLTVVDLMRKEGRSYFCAKPGLGFNVGFGNKTEVGVGGSVLAASSVVNASPFIGVRMCTGMLDVDGRTLWELSFKVRGGYNIVGKGLYFDYGTDLVTQVDRQGNVLIGGGLRGFDGDLLRKVQGGTFLPPVFKQGGFGLDFILELFGFIRIEAGVGLRATVANVGGMDLGSLSPEGHLSIVFEAPLGNKRKVKRELKERRERLDELLEDILE